ncbi:spaetzle-processing enzyme-like [Drosophila obscura]|uniref:spaetzle-processing enzyme-like n=1 Tax=Drosophila obscura TaxID=7282 RepID=UPI001BB26BCA|nr:spaetzle-processing enzyme-like [Drosophila obscura]
MGECGQTLASFRITGGSRTDLYEFPWLALIRHEKPRPLQLSTLRDLVKLFAEAHTTFDCVGATINFRYVLTAAHCVVSRGLIESVAVVSSVRLVEWNVESAPDSFLEVKVRKFCAASWLEIAIEKRIVHDGYVPDSSDQFNDISLLRLKQRVG